MKKYGPEDGFPYYFELAKSDTLLSLFSTNPTKTLLQSIGDEKANFSYAPDKWSIKQVVGHIADHERIKMFRAFQLSRNEKVQLWGYDQVSLVNNSRFHELSLSDLLKDFSNVRKASASFVNTLSQSQLQIKGMARENEITLEEFLRSIIGHERHHINIILEKYDL